MLGNVFGKTAAVLAAAMALAACSDSGGDAADGSAGQPGTGGVGAGGRAGGGAGGATGPSFDAPFLWQPVVFEGATDFGHQAAPIAEARQASAIQLVDATEAAGLGSAVGGGNSHGVGIAFVDLDQDLLPDILVANGQQNRGGRQFSSLLYKNNGDGTFSDATASSGIGALIGDRDVYSVASGDYDNDGDVDLYFGAQPTDILLANEGSLTFRDLTLQAGAGGPASNPAETADGRSKIGVFGDFDNDGFLDVVTASSTLPAPGVYLLKNNGDATFRDVSAQSGVEIDGRGHPCAVLFSDFDNDRDFDLWIWNDRGGKVLLRNDALTAFTNINTSSTIDDFQIGNPMGIDGADIDHDGDLDYYISAIGNNPLLRNNGDGTLTNITSQANTMGDFGWGLGFEDFDADGWQDIFVAQEDDRTYLVFHNLAESPSRFERLDFGHGPIVSSGAAHNVAVAFADYNRDGRTDVVTATTDGSRINLFSNQTDLGTNRWLEVVVPSAPGTGARGGVGARVIVKTGALVQFEEIHGGSSRASQNDHTARFGIGQWTGAEWVAVQWADGRQVVMTGVVGNQQLVVP